MGARQAGEVRGPRRAAGASKHSVPKKRRRGPALPAGHAVQESLAIPLLWRAQISGQTVGEIRLVPNMHTRKVGDVWVWQGRVGLERGVWGRGGAVLSE